MAGKGPFVVEAWAPWKIWGGHLPTPDPPQMAKRDTHMTARRFFTMKFYFCLLHRNLESHNPCDIWSQNYP